MPEPATDWDRADFPVSIALSPETYIAGYRQLVPLGVGLYPVNRDKSPAVQGKLHKVATIDPIKIRFWVEHRHHRNFAARILRPSRLLVIDTEHPFKHPDRPGPDGEMFLGSLLEDLETTLPPCPLVETGSGSSHRYLLVPRGFPIRPTVSLWPGIDILAAGSSVILPGSRTDAGEYRVIRSFEQYTIPEAPLTLVKLIRKVQKTRRRATRPSVAIPTLVTEADTSEVSLRQWWLLFRNQVFRSFWKWQGKAGDATDSAYEYHLAKACFCCGLNHPQAESVIMNWRRKHALNRDIRQLRNGILPKAWAEVEPWVEHWHAAHEAAAEVRLAAKTGNMILALMKHAASPQTPATVAASLAIPRERAKKSMQRIAKDGKLIRTPEGYKLP